MNINKYISDNFNLKYKSIIMIETLNGKLVFNSNNFLLLI